MVITMDCFERLRGSYDGELARTLARRDALIETIRGHIPPNPEAALADGTDEIELEWAQVADPRGTGDSFQVLPVFPVEWVDDDSGFSSEPGVAFAAFYGRLPSGEESLIGIMGLDTAHLSDADDITLQLRPETHPEELTRWDSADAELFLGVAEAAMHAQTPAAYSTR